MNPKTAIITLTAIFTVIGTYAQTGKLRGHLYDEETREPVAFASVSLSLHKKNFSSDFDGNFSIPLDSLQFSDTLICSFSGFKPFKMLVSKTSDTFLQIEMNREVIEMKGILISVKTNPALKWVKLAQDHRKDNDPERLDHYECRTFTSNTIAVNKISDKIKKGKLGKEIGTLFDTISYISNDKSKAILPVFISEVVSNFYFNKNPHLTKEVILASRIKGVGVQDGTFVSQLLGSTFIGYNFYQNTLVVIDKGIASPISENAMNIYNYRLTAVDRSGPRRIFQIWCEPRIEKDLAFKGFIWIEDTTGALVRLSLELNNNSNLNYIEKLRVTQEYVPTTKGAYFCSNSRVIVDAAEVNTKAAGVIATSTINYSALNVNAEHEPRFFDNRLVMEQDATDKGDTFWENHRPVKQTEDEKRIMRKIDTLVKLPSVKTYVDLVNFLVDGYFDIGKFDKVQLGPYYSLVSWNRLEGFRARLGFRTSYKLSRNWLIEGMGAYGFKDNKWKYSFRAERILNRKRWTKIGALHRYDVELIGFTDNDENATGVFTAFNLLGSRNLVYSRDSRLIFGTDLKHGLRFSMTLGNRQYHFTPIDTFNFAWYNRYPDTFASSRNFTNTSVTFNLRYAPRDYFLQNDNRRVNFTGIGAVYYASFTRGFKGLLNGHFNYNRLTVGMSYIKVWGTVGRTQFNVEGTKIWENLPYPLLNIFIGNQSYVYNTAAYNQMRIFEFVTDQSVSGSLEHHFNGFFFNRIPLIKRLKWREIINAKTIYGTLGPRNFNFIPKQIEGIPVTQFKSFDKIPYLEIGAGIENIFKLLRIDAIWRLTYRDSPGARPFGVKASIAVQF